MENDILWFIFHEGRLLLRSGESGPTALPVAAEAPVPSASIKHSLGMFRGMPCLAYAVDALPEDSGLVPVDLRASYTILGEEPYLVAGKGAGLLNWEVYSRWCPGCGVPTVPATPISKRCPSCNREMFPQVATAILALIRKEETTLLVRAHNFRGPFYGLVAGFLEVGESLEDCVRREVMEETGLSIGNVTYFGSQPWPFPSGLMVGFISDWVAGELRIEPNELKEAAFYTRDRLPELPHPISLTRRMIDWWRGAGVEGGPPPQTPPAGR